MTLLNRSWRSLYGLRSPNSLVTFVTVRNVALSKSIISSALVSLAKSCKYPSMMCKFGTKDLTISPHALYRLWSHMVVPYTFNPLPKTPLYSWMARVRSWITLSRNTFCTRSILWTRAKTCAEGEYSARAEMTAAYVRRSRGLEPSKERDSTSKT